MEIPENVIAFIDKAAGYVGKFEEVTFNNDCRSECTELGMESPIEQLLYSALRALAKLNFISEADDPIQENGEWHNLGLSIIPQVKVGKYRVDFKISHERKLRRGWEEKSIIIECDSQQFHDRSEQERRYEKQRDRFLIQQGETILHFTGAEIHQNPWQVAAEILEAVCTDRPNSEELLSALEEL